MHAAIVLGVGLALGVGGPTEPALALLPAAVGSTGFNRRLILIGQYVDPGQKVRSVDAADGGSIFNVSADEGSFLNVPSARRRDANRVAAVLLNDFVDLDRHFKGLRISDALHEIATGRNHNPGRPANIENGNLYRLNVWRVPPHADRIGGYASTLKSDEGIDRFAGGFGSTSCRPSGDPCQYDRNDQAERRCESDKELGSGPICALGRSVRGLPLGAQIGIGTVLWLGAIGFVAKGSHRLLLDGQTQHGWGLLSVAAGLFGGFALYLTRLT